MSIPTPSVTPIIGVSLVDGDAAVRHARQIMLRSENYDVRSYATTSAILSDPRSRDYPCIVLDIELNDSSDGTALLREMRATGWHGRAVLLDDQDASSVSIWEANQNDDRVMQRTVGDISLVAAVSSSITRAQAG